MGSFGQETYDSIGYGITVTADGAPKAKAGGVTIDWDSVPAFANDAEFEGFQKVKSGDKFLRYGTILVKITAASDATKVGKFTVYGATVAGGTLSEARGDIFILNESVNEDDHASSHPAVIDGGRVYKERLNIDSNDEIVYDESGPTAFDQMAEDDFLAAFPQISFA